MDRTLPAPLQLAAEAGVRAFARAALDLEAVEPGKGLLALWLMGATSEDMEYRRVLAIHCARRRDSAALACRIWLMTHHGCDLGVINTLLGALDSDLVETDSWLPAVRGVAVPFLRACATHSSPAIRTALLATLRQAAEGGILGRALPPEYLRWLGDAVETTMADIADDEEAEDIRLIQRTVRDPTDAGWRPPRPTQLARVAIDVDDLIARWEHELGPLQPLVQHVRRQQLLDDAGLKAATSAEPLQTIRFVAERAPTRVVDAFVRFGEALVSLVRDPDFSEVSLPDYGTSIGWAPAASVPFHLFFGAAESRRAFEILERLRNARRSQERDAALEDVEPQIASAIQGLITRVRDEGGSVEVVLTDPHDPSWQRSLVIDEGLWKPSLLGAIAQRAATSAPGGRVVLYKDHVPQANTVRQVFQAVDAMILRGAVTPDDIDDVNSDRQANYYKHGARTLGLFDADNQPTGRAFALMSRDHNQRLALTAVFFEDSPLGRAWRRWAGRPTMAEVDPESAEAFLLGCAIGLTGTTPRRRASTLRTWYAELMPHYPIR